MRTVKSITAKSKRISRAKSCGEMVAAGLAEAQEVGDCLEWQGPFGGGKKKSTAIVKARSEKGRTDNFAVARELWIAAYSDVPEGMLIYRRCCNNACVLLDHLTIGTRKDWAKARMKAGATKHQPTTLIALTLAARRRATAVNTIEKARAVRMLVAGGACNDEIVEETGVSKAMVADIRQGRSWKEMASPFAGLGARG